MFIITGIIGFLPVAELPMNRVTGETHQRVTRETKDIGTKVFALNNVKRTHSSLRFLLTIEFHFYK
jgi:hypothetical protein